MDTIKEVISKAGGPARLARELKISPQAVFKWRRVPADRVLIVERLSGVSRHLLRPDVYGVAPATESAHG